ncbi:M23 family metallopeptidase [Streptomyces sp. NPDC002055]|uniref:M23 family metallopeptidase n=1 Tax=Streptomyces sp. NPDC002055 TaxID=3154534 RepID=UPI00332E871F
MRKHTQTTTANKSVLRRRAAVLAAGMGASVALGSGVALASADASAPQHDVFATKTAGSLSQAVQAQADGQHKAAEKDAAKAKAKAAAKAEAKKRAAEKAAADRKKRAAKLANPATWVKPVDHYTKGSTFGLGGSHWSNKHSGQDFVVPTGTSVKATHSGTVVEAGWGGSYGNNIVIKHGDKTYTQYGHLSTLGVSAGQTVKTGQEIGKSGSTGNSTGPHLHFETRTAPVYGFAVEPIKFLKSHGVHA